MSHVDVSERTDALHEYQQDKSGPLSGNFAQVGGFSPGAADTEWPSIQLT